MEKWTKGCNFRFPKKGKLRNSKNYKGIKHTVINTKVQKILLLNRIQSKIIKTFPLLCRTVLFQSACFITYVVQLTRICSTVDTQIKYIGYPVGGAVESIDSISAEGWHQPNECCVAQSALANEYTDCIAEGKTHPMRVLRLNQLQL